jgi:D-alanyl-D-alanine dipeptidase
MQAIFAVLLVLMSPLARAQTMPAAFVDASRGSTVDLTLVRRTGGERADNPDMGTPFDFFSPKSWPADMSVGETARGNRALLAAAMARAGFRAYVKEWWHFTLRNEAFPASYFNFPVR